MELSKYEAILRQMAASINPRYIVAELAARASSDEIENAAENSLREFAAGNVDMERVKALLIDLALKRIKSGEFGACMACGERIDEKRLNAVPQSPFCINCQTMLDEGGLEGFDRYRIQRSSATTARPPYGGTTQRPPDND